MSLSEAAMVRGKESKRGLTVERPAICFGCLQELDDPVLVRRSTRYPGCLLCIDDHEMKEPIVNHLLRLAVTWSMQVQLTHAGCQLLLTSLSVSGVHCRRSMLFDSSGCGSGGKVIHQGRRLISHLQMVSVMPRAARRGESDRQRRFAESAPADTSCAVTSSRRVSLQGKKKRTGDATAVFRFAESGCR